MSTPTLENWSILFFDEPYTAPEARSARLGGTVYNHPDIDNGSPIVTSKLKKFSSAKMTAETNNRQYILGKPSDAFMHFIQQGGHKLSDYNKELDGVI